MTNVAATDVLVVGGGPAGSAAAWWLADAGHDVTLVEREVMPRERPCGDALTPFAVDQLVAMQVHDDLAEAHRTSGIRLSAHGRSMEMPWPADTGITHHGLTIRRRELDRRLLDHAARRGATVWTGVHATEPIVEHGHLRGAALEGDTDSAEIRARFVVIADGPLSHFGRALGTARSRTFAMGIASRAYFRSAHHDEPWIESGFDLRDNTGEQLPGYGWVFPLGDGSVNVGVGLLSHHHGSEAIAPAVLFEQWMRQLPSRWEIDPEDQLSELVGGRLPMGASVRPRSGPNWVVVGDAAGSVNPFNGDGVGPALANGRLAAEVLSEALAAADGLVLRRYEAELDASYDRYYKLGRLATRALGQPGLMRRLTRMGIRSRWLTELTMRTATGLLRQDGRGPTHRVARAAERIASWIPDD